jgi:hypothetical protein
LGLKNLFKLFVSFLKDADLIGCEIIAIDGTKKQSTTVRKRTSIKKIERHLVYIEERTQEYLAELAKNDLQDNSITITKIAEAIKRINYATNSRRKLKGSGQPQISTTDQDARALLVQGVVVEISYNIQAAVDNKHNLATHTINRNDLNALELSFGSKENLARYFYLWWIKATIMEIAHNNITTIVAHPTPGRSKEKYSTRIFGSSFGTTTDDI